MLYLPSEGPGSSHHGGMWGLEMQGLVLEEYMRSDVSYPQWLSLCYRREGQLPR